MLSGYRRETEAQLYCNQPVKRETTALFAERTFVTGWSATTPVDLPSAALSGARV